MSQKNKRSDGVVYFDTEETIQKQIFHLSDIATTNDQREEAGAIQEDKPIQTESINEDNLANDAVESNSGRIVDEVRDLPVTNNKPVVDRLYVFDGENFVPYHAAEQQPRELQSISTDRISADSGFEIVTGATGKVAKAKNSPTHVQKGSPITRVTSGYSDVNTLHVHVNMTFNLNDLKRGAHTSQEYEVCDKNVKVLEEDSVPTIPPPLPPKTTNVRMLSKIPVEKNEQSIKYTNRDKQTVTGSPKGEADVVLRANKFPSWVQPSDPMYDKPDLEFLKSYDSVPRLKKQVTKLMGNPWFFTYQDMEYMEQCKETIKSDGSFIVVAQDIRVNPFQPFTVIVRTNGGFINVPILMSKPSELDKPTYTMLNVTSQNIVYALEQFVQNEDNYLGLKLLPHVRNNYPLEDPKFNSTYDQFNTRL